MNASNAETMQCPSCGYQNSPVKFVFPNRRANQTECEDSFVRLPVHTRCPKCDIPLESNKAPSKIDHDEHGVEPTLLPQSDASTESGNSDLEEDNRLKQGKLYWGYSWLSDSYT